jgi:hypothetical protein
LNIAGRLAEQEVEVDGGHLRAVQLLALWTLPDTQLLTSAYAIVEADRNVVNAEQRTRLYRLIQGLEIVDEPRPRHRRILLGRCPSGNCDAANGVASEWSVELADPGEDIYALNAGQPVVR